MTGLCREAPATTFHATKRLLFIVPLSLRWRACGTSYQTRNMVMMCSPVPNRKEVMGNKPAPNDGDSDKSDTTDQPSEDRKNVTTDEDRIAKLKKIRKLMFANRKVKSFSLSPLKGIPSYCSMFFSM